MTPELAAENAQVGMLVQAMLGLITPSMRLITLEMLASGTVKIHFLIEREDPRTQADLEDILFEFEALSELHIDVGILVDTRPRHEIKLPGRWVYARSEHEYDIDD
jgi:hypothetical protein